MARNNSEKSGGIEPRDGGTIRESRFGKSVQNVRKSDRAKLNCAGISTLAPKRSMYESSPFRAGCYPE
jgi:hypothetical protein